MNFDTVMNFLCKDLPEGYQIIIECENGCGAVKLLIPGSDAEIEDDTEECTLQDSVFNLLRVSKSGLHDEK